MSAVNENLIRDVVAEVLGRLGQGTSLRIPSTPPAAQSCACTHEDRNSGFSARRGKFGVFQDANEACAAANEGFLQLKTKGVAARARVVELIKAIADAKAVEWGKLELDETKIGRLDHKIEKLQILELVPGVEFLKTNAFSGSNGVCLEEFAPFGVIGIKVWIYKGDILPTKRREPGEAPEALTQPIAQPREERRDRPDVSAGQRL